MPSSVALLPQVTASDVLAAQARLRKYLDVTPVHYAERFGCWLKLENLQRTGSYKVRGALNALLAARERGDTQAGCRLETHAECQYCNARQIHQHPDDGMEPIDLLAIHDDERSHVATRPFGCVKKLTRTGKRGLSEALLLKQKSRPHGQLSRKCLAVPEWD